MPTLLSNLWALWVTFHIHPPPPLASSLHSNVRSSSLAQACQLLLLLFFFSPTLIHTAFFFFLIPYHNLILKQTIHTHSWVPGQQYNYKDALKPLSFQSTPLFSFTQHHHTMGFPSGSEGKESACNAGDLGSIPGLGRSPGGGHSNPLQYTCLENPHRQRNLVGYSPWRCKESGRTGQLSVSHHTIKGDVLPALQVKTVRSGDLCRCTYRHRYEYSNRNETYI